MAIFRVTPALAVARSGKAISDVLARLFYGLGLMQNVSETITFIIKLPLRIKI